MAILFIGFPFEGGAASNNGVPRMRKPLQSSPKDVSCRHTRVIRRVFQPIDGFEDVVAVQNPKPCLEDELAVSRAGLHVIGENERATRRAENPLKDR
jgi:hypothetical protein